MKDCFIGIVSELDDTNDTRLDAQVYTMELIKVLADLAIAIASGSPKVIGEKYADAIEAIEKFTDGTLQDGVRQ